MSPIALPPFYKALHHHHMTLIPVFLIWPLWTFSVAVLVWLVAVLAIAILVYGRFGCNPFQILTIWAEKEYFRVS